MHAVYAFCREVDDIVDNSKTAAISRIKLAWWHEAIDNVVSSPQHPVCLALAPVIKRYNIPLSYFHDIIAGMEMDLDVTTYEDDLALSRYCYHAAGAVGIIIVTILGYKDQRTIEFAKQLGETLQRINILRDIIEDAERGRVYLPIQVLTEYQLSPQLLLGRDLGAEQQAQLIKLVSDQAKAVKTRYQRAMASLPAVDRKAQKVSILMGELYHRLLEKIAAEPQRVLQGRIRLSKLEKLWVVGRGLVR